MAESAGSPYFVVTAVSRTPKGIWSTTGNGGRSRGTIGTTGGAASGISPTRAASTGTGFPSTGAGVDWATRADFVAGGLAAGVAGRDSSTGALGGKLWNDCKGLNGSTFDRHSKIPPTKIKPTTNNKTPVLIAPSLLRPRKYRVAVYVITIEMARHRHFGRHPRFELVGVLFERVALIA